MILVSARTNAARQDFGVDVLATNPECECDGTAAATLTWAGNGGPQKPYSGSEGSNAGPFRNPLSVLRRSDGREPDRTAMMLSLEKGRSITIHPGLEGAISASLPIRKRLPPFTLINSSSPKLVTLSGPAERIAAANDGALRAWASAASSV